MTTAQAPFGGVKKGVLALILIWFFIFAIGDLVTTFWLILHDPAGISNEGNPFAASLYAGGGFTYLIVAKVGICLALELAFIFTWSRHSQIRWFQRTLEVSILSLIGYSIIIIYNNFLAIIIIEALSAPSSLKDFRVTETGMLILSLILNILLLYLSKVKEVWMYVEASIATIVFLGPLILWRPFFQWYLREQPFFYFAYLASILTMFAVTFYITDQIVKEKKAKSGIIRSK